MVSEDRNEKCWECVDFQLTDYLWCLAAKRQEEDFVAPSAHSDIGVDKESIKTLQTFHHLNNQTLGRKIIACKVNKTETDRAQMLQKYAHVIDASTNE
jgi:hypothetical protein